MDIVDAPIHSAVDDADHRQCASVNTSSLKSPACAGTGFRGAASVNVHGAGAAPSWAIVTDALPATIRPVRGPPVLTLTVTATEPVPARGPDAARIHASEEDDDQGQSAPVLTFSVSDPPPDGTRADDAVSA
jgi:hypothetical protein